MSATEPHRGPVEPGGRARALTRALARGADEVVGMILDPEMPDVDIDIAIERLRERAEADFPGTGALFERIYGARFRRLRGQWRRG